MKFNLTVTEEHMTDIAIARCGTEACKPSHHFGPGVRDHYQIHYIHSGKGFYEIGGERFELSEGQIFTIFPNTTVYYKADKDNPWVYTWIGFSGFSAADFISKAGLSVTSPCCDVSKSRDIKWCFEYVRNMAVSSKGREITLIGLLVFFFGVLMDLMAEKNPQTAETRQKEYVRRAVEYITENYYKKITIEDIANEVGKNRSYLGSLFTKICGMSPQDYLIKYRMDKACELLKNHRLQIGEIANSVGYSDQLLFSRMFKKTKGVSPRTYRTNYIKNMT